MISRTMEVNSKNIAAGTFPGGGFVLCGIMEKKVTEVAAMFLLPEGTTLESRLVREDLEWSLV